MASTPSRAVATTRTSPVSASPPPSTSTSTRRISALSSATSTVGRRSDDVLIGSHRADLDPAVLHVKAHGAAALTAHRLAQDGDFGGAQGDARRHDVALADLNRAGRHQLAEHA